MRKVFIYHRAGEKPYQVRVCHPATTFLPQVWTVLPVEFTPISKLKKLMAEMYEPCEIFTVEIFEQDYAIDKEN